MQSLGAVGMDPDMLVYRERMRERITQILQRCPVSNAEISQRLPDIVGRLEEALYRTAATKEDYLNMETLESRLHSVLRGYPNHNQPLGRRTSSSSPVSAMIPTRGMSHSNSSNLAVPSSLDNSMIVTSGSGNIESTTVHMGNIAQSANGIAGHNGSFSMSDGNPLQVQGGRSEDDPQVLE